MQSSFIHSRRFFAFVTALLACILLSACRGDSNEDPAAARVFARSGIKGSFVLHELKSGKYIHYNRTRNGRGFLPASTFKVMNSLIALETGVVRDAKHVLKWDGKKRAFDFWNRDHDLRSAIRWSVVWYYRELARRVGEKRMGSWLEKTGYGNGDLSAGVDLFWLQGGFRVTPLEQIRLLKRLFQDDLPFSKRSMSIVKDIMLVEKKPGYVIRGKTGLAVRGKKAIGWWIGWVEKKDDVYFFATCIEVAKADRKFIAARKGITREILTRRGILPAQ